MTPARLVAEPDLMATAVEEFLRAYAPVTMARVVTGRRRVRGMRDGRRGQAPHELSRPPTATPPPSTVPMRWCLIGPTTAMSPSEPVSTVVPDRIWPGWSSEWPSRSGWPGSRRSDWPMTPWSPGPVARCGDLGRSRWCSREDRRGRGEVPGPRPLLRLGSRVCSRSTTTASLRSWATGPSPRGKRRGRRWPSPTVRSSPSPRSTSDSRTTPPTVRSSSVQRLFALRSSAGNGRPVVWMASERGSRSIGCDEDTNARARTFSFSTCPSLPGAAGER